MEQLPNEISCIGRRGIEVEQNTMRHPCPACNYPNPAGSELCGGCGASLAAVPGEPIRRTRKTPVSAPEPIPVTRAVPQAPPAVRHGAGESARPVRKEEPPHQAPLGVIPLLQRWSRIPEKAEDGTARFCPQHSKPLFALVWFGRHGIPAECQVLRATQITLGREEGSVQIINDPAVSGRHAQLAYRDDMSLVLTDLNSTNGTYFRIRPSQGYRLWNGCNLIIGQQLLTYCLASDVVPRNRPGRVQTMAMSTVSKSDQDFGMLVVAGTGTEPHEFLLTGPTVIGRSNDMAQLVFPEDSFLSPAHARVEFNVKVQQAIITDLKSLNGVYVQIRQPVVLEDGDMFRLGEQIFGVVQC